MSLRSQLLFAGAVTCAGVTLALALVLPGSTGRIGSTVSAAEHRTPTPADTPAASAKPTADAFGTKLKPFLAKYCTSCHNADDQAAGVALDAYKSDADVKKDRKVWEMVPGVVADGSMPPKKKKGQPLPQPTKEERAGFVGAVGDITRIDCTAPTDAGRVTLRRLNRAEYNNTVRDLCGVDFKPAEDFPSDDVGYGFDNIGDVLSLQPIMIEKYLAAADKVLETAIVSLEPVKSEKQTFRAQQLQAVPRGSKSREPVKITFTTDGAAFVEKFNFQADGEYAIRVRTWGTKVGDAAPKLVIRIDGKDQKEFAVEAPTDKPVTVEAKVKVLAGERRVAAGFVNPFEDKDEKDAAKKFRTLGVVHIEIEGPFGKVEKPLPDSTKLVLAHRPSDGVADKVAAEKTLTEFARRAYRRPVKPAELVRLMKLYDLAAGKGEPFEQAIKLPMKAVMVSPHFLFRIEDDPKTGETARTLNEYELATRLSYFLWATMPDEELYRLADKGELRKPGVLKAQIARMLKDKKAVALTDNFAGQWLMLRSVQTAAPDPTTYPNWDEPLRKAMIREAELYFEYVVRNDRPVTEFLDSDYTFVNSRLAVHYKLTKFKGTDFEKVTLPDDRRGGILTMASVLTVTSNPTRTSPVKRGKWVLDNLLGTPPPPPAPDVPQLEATPLTGTIRQQTEQHRANPACATCHAKLDPLGFGLENFNGIGEWRTEDRKDKIDASGVLPDGAKFDGPGELRKILLGKADLFRRCLAEKLLTYALGRGLEYYDKCALDALVAKLKAGGDSVSALVLAIAESDPFQKRQAKRAE